MHQIVDDVQRHLNQKSFPPELPPEAAATHMGLFLGWAIERKMISEEMQARYATELKAFCDRSLTGVQIVDRLGGVLESSFFSDELRRFSERYYPKCGRFMFDYVHTFMRQIIDSVPQSMYQVSGSWKNQARLSATLDERLDEWRQYPPAAEHIFSGEVGAGSYHYLEAVTQTALVSAAQVARRGESISPMLVYLQYPNLIFIPRVLQCGRQSIDVTSVPGVWTASQYLREALGPLNIIAFAVAVPERVRPVNGAGTIDGVGITAEHYKSGPHRVFGGYRVDADGKITFERPVRVSSGGSGAAIPDEPT